MPVIRFRDFNGGICLGLPSEQVPQGKWRRFTGAHHVPTNSFRTRLGSTAIDTTADTGEAGGLLFGTPHSLWTGALGNAASTDTIEGVFLTGDSTALYAAYQNSAAVITPIGSLDGTRMTMAAFPGAYGKDDCVFVSGAGTLFKIRYDTNYSPVILYANWGVDAPTDTSFGGSTAAGTALPGGDYKLQFTYVHAGTGAESNGSPVSVITVTAGDKITTSGRATSADTQVTHQNIYISPPDAADTYFFQQTTTALSPDFTDLDDLDLTRPIPTDNTPPDDTYEDFCVHLARIFWARVDAKGERGRVYYSPPGRPDSVQGFIQLSSDDEETQKVVVFGGQLYLFTRAYIYRIDGLSEPFIFSRTPSGVGTNYPFSVVSTKRGVFYLADDGIRVFDGVNCELINFAATGRLFRGETIEDTDFLETASTEDVVAGFYHDEYWLTNGSITICMNVMTGRTRIIDKGYKCFFHRAENDDFFGLTATQILRLAQEGTYDDGGAAIHYEVQTPTIRGLDHRNVRVQSIVIDANLNNTRCYVEIVEEGRIPEIIATLRWDNSRQSKRLRVNLDTKDFAVRLRGDVKRPVEIFGIDVEVRGVDE